MCGFVLCRGQVFEREGGLAEGLSPEGVAVSEVKGGGGVAWSHGSKVPLWTW